MLYRVSHGVCLAVLLTVLCFPSWSLSQQSSEEPDVQEMDQVVVSATKTRVPLREVTSAVEVWTEEDFQLRKIKTVVEALRLSQGTAVFQSGGPGTASSVRIRGGDAEQTLVLIDGAIVNSATLGTFNFGHLTVDNIEKIEIVRGAQSTLWGADAMGGVIAITTKRGRGPLKAGGFFEYGAFNTVREGGTLSGRKGPLDVSLALSRWDTTGISAINYRRGASERDAYRNWQGSARFGLALPADGRFDFSFRWVDGSLDIDSSFGPSDVSEATNDSRQFIFSGRWRQPLAHWWTHVLTLSRSQETSFFHPGISQRNLSSGVVSVPFGNPDETRVLANRIESQHDFRLNQYVTVTMGYQFREQQGENDSGLSRKITASHGGFGQAQFNLFDRLFATAGVRHDRFNTFGDATTYRVTGGYLVKAVKTKIRGSYATGFRAPNINELFFPDFGNPNVQPEKSQSFDVGVDQPLFNERVTVSGGYFWNRYRNLIQTLQSAAICGTGDFGANYCPVNAALAKSQGWEGAINMVVMRDRPWAQHLALRWQYSATLTRDLVTSERFIRWPVHQSSVSVVYQPIEPLSVILDVRFSGSKFAVDRSQVDSFTVVNLAANYDISERTQAYVRVDNLFDEVYEEVLNFGTPGLSVFGGLRVNFEVPGL